MRLNTLVRSVLGVALASLMLTGAAAAAQNRSNKGGQDAGNVGDERAAQVHSLNAAKKKPKKDKDKDPSKSTNKTHGMHKANGHTH